MKEQKCDECGGRIIEADEYTCEDCGLVHGPILEPNREKSFVFTYKDNTESPYTKQRREKKLRAKERKGEYAMKLITMKIFRDIHQLLKVYCKENKYKNQDYASYVIRKAIFDEVKME